MAGGIGTGLSPILARRVTGDNERKMRQAIIFAFGFSAVGMLTGTIVLNATSKIASTGGLSGALLMNFCLVLLGILIQGAGGGLNWVFSTQLLLQLLPDRVRGRVFSTEFAMMTLANAISAAVGGWALDGTGLGIPGMMGFVAGLLLIPGALWAVWTLRRQHQMAALRV